MHLDELHSADDLKVRHHLIRHLAGTDSVQRELHSQEIIGIASEGLPVEKIPPAADDLAENDAAARGISQKSEGNLLFPVEIDHREDRSDDASVDRQPSLPGVQDA